MIDLVLTLAEYGDEQPEIPCQRCGKPFGDRAVLLLRSMLGAEAAEPDLVVALCVPCFLVKVETWQQLGQFLRGEDSDLKVVGGGDGGTYCYRCGCFNHLLYV